MFKILKKVINLPLEKLNSLIYKEKKRQGNLIRSKFKNLDELFENHFQNIKDHPCKQSVYNALKIYYPNPLNIIETGSSAWGMNSTVLFDSYVNSFGGSFNSVDIRSEPMFELQKKCSLNTIIHCDDSINFLKKFHVKFNFKNLIYLDSIDVNWKNPISSMKHGLKEFLTISDKLQKGDLILIDDTPKNEEILKKVQGEEKLQQFVEMKKKNIIGGKGSLVIDFLEKQGNKKFKVIEHEYQILISVML